jgi:hypothetical protein
VVAIELDTDLAPALMQPGVHVPDGREVLLHLLHRPEWQQGAGCAGHSAARWFRQGAKISSLRSGCAVAAPSGSSV